MENRKESLMKSVSLGLSGHVKEGIIVAITSSSLMQGSSSSIYASYDIGRIVQVNDDNSYNLIYIREPNSMIYAAPTYINAMAVPHSKLRFIVREDVVDVNENIVLDNFTVEMIVKICFNGSN
jgi:hypothetical protein